MKKVLIAMSALLAVNVCQASENTKHLVSIGTEGLGWSGTAENYKTGKNIDSAKTSEGSLQLNYAYLFENKFMAGLEIGSKTTGIEVKTTAGDKSTIDTATTRYALNAGYNFNDDFFNSWWVQVAYGAINKKTETKTTSKVTDENDATGFSLRVGKRFSFAGLGLNNITYSPSISYSSKTWTGDNADLGFDKSAELQLNVLKFDILF